MVAVPQGPWSDRLTIQPLSGASAARRSASRSVAPPACSKHRELCRCTGSEDSRTSQPVGLVGVCVTHQMAMGHARRAVPATPPTMPATVMAVGAMLSDLVSGLSRLQVNHDSGTSNACLDVPDHVSLPGTQMV